jgi:hypothetical protein
MKRKAGLLAIVAGALLSLPAGAAAAVSFSQSEYTLATYKLPGSVQSEIGGSNSLFEPNTPVAVGDMNGDGHPDVLASDYQKNVIYVLLGDGTGKFSPAPESPYSTGTCLHPDSLLTGDFNEDGKRDVLAECGSFSEEIQMFAGAGNGAIAPTTTHFKGEGPMFAGNLDGDADLVFDKFPSGTCTLDIENLGKPGDQSEASICYGAEQQGSSVHYYTSLCGGDEWFSFGPLIGEERSIELATVEHDDEEHLFACDKAATSPPFDSGVPLSAIPNSLATADLTGDGVPDVIATDDAAPGRFHIVGVTKSEGGLSFSAPAGITSLANISGSGYADFNRDGKVDLMAGEWGPSFGDRNRIVVHPGTGSTTVFGAPESTPVFGGNGQDTYPKPVVVDFNGDGKPDIVTDGDECDAEETSCSTKLIVLINGSIAGPAPGETGGAAPPPGSGPPPGKFLGILLKGGTLKVTKGVVSLKVACPASAVGVCAGTATLTTVKAYAVRVERKRKVVLGAKSFSVPAGHTATLKVKLKPKAAKLLASKRSLLAREAIVAHDNRAHAVTTAATVKLVLAKAKHKR